LNKYEVMLLLDPAFASNEEEVNKEIGRLMERAGAEIITQHRWDERRLAFEIKRRKRGVYLLVYVRGPNTSVGSLERDVQLSEGILRALILRADHVSEEKMQNPIAPPSEFARRGGDEWSRGGRRSEGRGGPDARRERERPKEKAAAPSGAEKAEPVTEAVGPAAEAATAAEPDAAQAEPEVGSVESAPVSPEARPEASGAEASSEQAPS
jgi:small subunit ribosomal protein S6